MATTSAEQLALLAQIREDLERHDGRWAQPGFQALAIHRFGTWLERRPGNGGGLPAPVTMALTIVHRILYMLARNVYGIQLPVEATIGRRLRIAHQHGIVLIQGSIVGDDCLIRHNVTLGQKARGMPVPRLGDRVQIGTGAVIVGGITVGDDARIGPNAIVINDVPPGGTVVAPVGRLVEQSPAAPQALGDAGAPG